MKTKWYSQINSGCLLLPSLEIALNRFMLLSLALNKIRLMGRMETVLAQPEGEAWDPWLAGSLVPNSSKEMVRIQWAMQTAQETMPLQVIQIQLSLLMLKLTKDQVSIESRITQRVTWVGHLQSTTQTCTASQPLLPCLLAWSTKRKKMCWGPSQAPSSTPLSQRQCYRRVKDSTATISCLTRHLRIWWRPHLIWPITPIIRRLR